MSNFRSKTFIKIKPHSAYTLLELLVVLVIVAIIMTLGIYAVMRFRQVIIVSNTAKELQLTLSRARRDSINNVITSNGQSPDGYYVWIDANKYYFGECAKSICIESEAKSKEYSGVAVTTHNCSGNSIIKFKAVTGEFVFTNSRTEMTSSSGSCEIEVSIGSIKRYVIVDANARTIKLK